MVTVEEAQEHHRQDAGDSEILFTREAAVFLRCGVDSLFRWARDPDTAPPVHHMNGRRTRRYYLRSELVDWLKGN